MSETAAQDNTSSSIGQGISAEQMIAEERIEPGSQDSAEPPSEQQILEIINRQLRIKSVQLKLQNVNTALAESRANELKALSLIAQISGMGQQQDTPGQPGEQPHALTDEDIKKYSILVNMKPGDLVMMSEVIREQKKLDEELQLIRESEKEQAAKEKPEDKEKEVAQEQEAATKRSSKKK